MNPKTYWITSASDCERIRGYKSKTGKSESVDFTLWKKGTDHDSYMPRRDTKGGRELYKEFAALPKWDTTELAQLVGYRDMFHESTIYFFSQFNYANTFCGIRVPVFDADSYKRDPKHITYKPIKGMKEVSWKQHNKKSAMTKAEYLATLPLSAVQLKPRTTSTKQSTRASMIKSRAGSTRTKGHSQSAKM